MVLEKEKIDSWYRLVRAWFNPAWSPRSILDEGFTPFALFLQLTPHVQQVALPAYLRRTAINRWASPLADSFETLPDPLSKASIFLLADLGVFGGLSNAIDGLGMMILQLAHVCHVVAEVIWDSRVWNCTLMPKETAPYWIINRVCFLLQ